MFFGLTKQHFFHPRQKNCIRRVSSLKKKASCIVRRSHLTEMIL